MNASLLVVRADGASQQIVLRSKRVLVGRGRDCELRVPAKSVSRHHCEFLTTGTRLIIRDLGSSNGTFVNRERVEEAQLTAGDLVCVGPAVFAVMLDGKPAGLDPDDVHARGTVELAEDQPPTKAYSGGAAAAAAALAGGAAAKPKKASDPDDSAMALDALGGGSDDSSVLDFDFDLGDDEDDDQPKL